MMMNPNRVGAAGLVFGSNVRHNRRAVRLGQSQEGGYTLVALLAIMTVLALLAMAAAPRIQQQVQRDREAEAIFRGEEIADAIRSYYKSHGQQGLQSLPTSMDQLLEGVQIPGGTKKIQILRQEAAHDPLSASGEWRLIRPRTQELIAFETAVISYSGNALPPPRDPSMLALQNASVPQIQTVLNTGSPTETAPPQVEADEPNATGPFVGVASRSSAGSVLNYYGLDHHNTWIFTPLFR